MPVHAFILFTVGLVAQMGPPPSDLHIVIESQRTSNAATRSLTTEYWLTRDRRYEKAGDRLRITRRDLGLRWTVDTRNGTYTEQTIAAAAPLSAPRAQVPAEDFHTAGFDYEPAFDWRVTDGGQTATLNGRACRSVKADGEADYAESAVTLWLCDGSGIQDVREVNAEMVALLRLPYASEWTFITDLLTSRGHPLLMSAEVRIEPPIAGTMALKSSIQEIAAAVAPAGTYDLPPGLQKAGRH